MSKRAFVVGAYCGLLLLSHGVRRLPGEDPPARAREAIWLAQRSAAGTLETRSARTRLAFQLWRPEDGPPEPQAVLLLHGSPGSHHDFDRLGPVLAERFLVVAPDLPGFGDSGRRVPDYSIRAHARYALALLDRLGIERVHVLGFSMGGGVALELGAMAPERVRSLILLSAIGVEEFELLGSQRLNHAVHALQLAGLWLLHEGVPHFGLLDDAMLSVPYARNFYDSDQRPLRDILRSWTPPTLIVHGVRDFLVPVEAAREHYRLVPQSELVLLESDHFMIFRGDPRMTRAILDFLDRAAAGRAPTREEAAAARLAAAAREFDPRDRPSATGVTLLVVMGLLALATLVTEDLTCIAAGLLVAQGRIGFLPAVLACGSGIFVGDLLLFWAGRRLGRPWLTRRPLSWLVSPATVARSAEWFEQRGAVVVLLSRFIPGARFPTYFAAGMLPLRLRTLLSYFFFAVLLWTPLLVGLALWLGAGIYAYFELFSRWALVGVLGSALAVWFLVFVLPRLFTFRGRRHLVGWWRRWTRWEFWPPWLFYFPVFWVVLWLGLRYRSLTLFTAANPGIDAGGFVGESKSRILAGLPREAVASFRRIEAGLEPAARAARVRAFLDETGGELPVVLKPDVGQRGKGVQVVRRWAEVEAYCAEASADFLVQEYVPGSEYGLFWLRMPGDEAGRLFSVTEKILPRVTGDGRSTLEALILADERAVAVAETYLRTLGEEAMRVPAAGESVRLTDLGTHCRGAVFRDGGHLASPALERLLDSWGDAQEGFCFGRYDVRVPDVESLTAGRDLTILELNGVTSEATSIYDPETSLLAAYRTLFQQWRLAFEIGRRNRRAGAPVDSVRSLLRRLVHHYRPHLRASVSPPS